MPLTPLSHVGLTVPDLDHAIDWYVEVIGFELALGPLDYTVQEGESVLQRALGPEVRRARSAMLATGGPVYLELFSFTEPPTRSGPEQIDYSTVGPWHIAVTRADVEELAQRIVQHGGSMHSGVMTLIEGTPYRSAICRDPFGLVLEIYSHSIDEILSRS